jgi:predicted nucleotidyltransferase
MKNNLLKEAVLFLSDNERKALSEFKEKINEKYPGTELILYGSKARGDFDEESDIDVLALIDGVIGKETKEYWVDIKGKPTIRIVAPVDKIEKDILGIKFNVELKYDIVIGLDIESKEYWDSQFSKITPIHKNIDKDGVAI